MNDLFAIYLRSRALQSRNHRRAVNHFPFPESRGIRGDIKDGQAAALRRFASCGKRTGLRSLCLCRHRRRRRRRRRRFLIAGKFR
jgi:hypothetical protein